MLKTMIIRLLDLPALVKKNAMSSYQMMRILMMMRILVLYSLEVMRIIVKI